ncbi:diguanylate cyclase [Desulfuromonas versatilis]|uniref:diguanylate cyclase n=1 Tax=Desulfuromonas versatilis TaxID=2802975 RepID=A0ABM8HZ36_9BACT|nr:diguanylate cyclase [Desulfuromonas versatilis]BCR06366.1 diguanylate cyclase [Desulfuromonas versatilis]
MAPDTLNQIPLGDLLKAIGSYPLFAPFNLALYCVQEGLAACEGERLTLCARIGENSLCDTSCRAAHEKAAEAAIRSNAPEVFRCPTGLLNFAVPFFGESDRPCCILGGGVREKNLELAKLESLSNAASPNGETLLERLEELPTASLEDVRETAREIHQLIPALTGKNIYARTLEKTTDRMHILTEVSAEMDRAPSAEELLALLTDTLVVLFDLKQALTLVTDEAGHCQAIQALGLSGKDLTPAPSRVAEVLKRHPGSKPVVLSSESAALVSGLKFAQALALPLSCDGQGFGLVLLPDADLCARDRMFAELLTGRAASRLLHLRQERERQRESHFSSRLITMISALSLVENRQELYGKIVEMSAELLQASRGSLMLLEETGSALKIAATLGMNQTLARSMKLEIGEGIAGRVAKTGFPLLVNDIEKDRRVATPNRPRYKTKSFISIPFKLKERIIGVVNLADKEDQQIFTQADLDLLTTFAAHASLMLERATSLERTSSLEQMSVTDPLTGIHNRRLLEERLNEELNRSQRQKLPFTVMLIDLDNFKVYNDLCGHIAGDNALKKSAALLKGSARDMDIVTRYGGEEFCIVLPATSKKESLFVAERIRRAIENHPFPGETGLPLGRLTTSIGVASFPEDGDSATGLINASDMALYKAKEQGRNRIVLYDQTLQELKQNHA